MTSSPHTTPPADPLDQALDAAYTELQRHSLGLSTAGLFHDRRLVDLLASIVDNTKRATTGSTDPMYRCEKLAGLTDSALVAQSETFEQLAVNGGAETLIAEAFDQVHAMMRRARTVCWSLAAGEPVPATAVADLNAAVKGATRWAESIAAMSEDGAA